MSARLRSALFVMPLDSSHARIARLTCSETGTPSRSQTSRRPSRSCSSIRNVVILLGITLYYTLIHNMTSVKRSKTSMLICSWVDLCSAITRRRCASA